MRHLLISLVCGTVACGGGDAPRSETVAAGADPPAKSVAPGTKDPNACHLLTHDEVAAVAGRRVTMADQIEAEDGYSKCQWEDSASFPVLQLTVYWKGGKQQFEIWRAAQGLGDQAFAGTEGATLDSMVKQGPVAGLGDAAYFSELLPSLLLKDDVMVEMTLSLVPKPETKFRPLATRLLGRL
jgi:hypothetical protein